MSHAVQADKLLIKPPAARQAGVAAHTRTIHSQGTHPRPEARRVTNDTDATEPGNGP